MSKRFLRDADEQYNAWASDQLLRSQFFHQKLHEWGVLEVAEILEKIPGEQWIWDIAQLGIAKTAWNNLNCG